jgi:3-hydroxybutyrate dehydrogenase
MRRIIIERAKELGTTYEAVERDYIEVTALKRMVEARDVAAMVLFLASDDADNITGQAIDIDAGYSL